jgi:hypothetical protein
MKGKRHLEWVVWLVDSVRLKRDLLEWLIWLLTSVRLTVEAHRQGDLALLDARIKVLANDAEAIEQELRARGIKRVEE